MRAFSPERITGYQRTSWRSISLAACMIACWSFSAIAAQPQTVTTKRLDELVVTSQLAAPANVIAANKSVISSQLAALVSEIDADVGSNVKKGDLLLRLDDSDVRLALATARGNLAASDARIENARARLKNAEELLTSNFISDEELLSRQTDLAVNIAARQVNVAAVEAQDLALRRTRVYAPFDAVVTSRSAQLGAYVVPGAPLLTLVQNDEREVDAEIDPRYANKLDSAQDLVFESRDQRWPVTLVRLSSVIESDSRIQHARFRFTGDAAPIGSSGNVVWVAATGLIPATYIVQRDTRLGVFVLDNGKAIFKTLPHAQEGRPVETDLPGATVLIVGGRARLQDGDLVTISQ